MRSEHAYGKLRYKAPKTQSKLLDLTNAPDGYALADLEKAEYYPDDPITNAEEFFCACLHVLNASPLAHAMIKDAAKQGWRVSLEENIDYDYALNANDKIIMLDGNALDLAAIAASSYFSNAVLVAFIKALRDVWQDKRNSGYENLFNPESILLLERVRTADICTVATLVAWELRSEGYGDIWRHMIGSDDGDLAMVFSGYLEREPCATFTHHALAVTFQQWFKNEDRVNACDHETLDMMDSLIQQPGRRPFGKKCPTHIAVELFSCLPDRTAYLRGDGAEILRDPSYSGLNNPVNQTHLFQILHDAQAVFAGNVPFRSAELAAKIFPEGGCKETLEERI